MSPLHIAHCDHDFNWSKVVDIRDPNLLISSNPNHNGIWKHIIYEISYNFITKNALLWKTGRCCWHNSPLGFDLKNQFFWQNRVNSMVWWLSRVLNHSEMTDPKRMDRNTQDHNSEVAEMYILLKDHKKLDSSSKQPVPCRPVVSGNGTYNVHLSELLS